MALNLVGLPDFEDEQKKGPVRVIGTLDNIRDWVQIVQKCEILKAALVQLPHVLFGTACRGEPLGCAELCSALAAAAKLGTCLAASRSSLTTVSKLQARDAASASRAIEHYEGTAGTTWWGTVCAIEQHGPKLALLQNVPFFVFAGYHYIFR